jgi:hypothetical protein
MHECWLLKRKARTVPRPVTTRSVKSTKGWASKSDQLALAFAPFATDGAARVAAGKSSRVAVAANLHDVVGLQAFTLTPQAAALLEADADGPLPGAARQERKSDPLGQ